MKRLFALEFRRLMKQLSTKIIFVIILLLGAINVYSAWALESQFDFFFFNSRGIIESSFQLGQIQVLVIGILTSLFIATDIQQGTIRNKIIAGYSKQKIYLVQMGMSAIITIIGLMLFHLLPIAFISLITFPITSDDGGSIANFFIHVGFGYALVIIGVLFTSWISLRAKNLAGAIIFTLLIFVLGPTLSTIIKSIIETRVVLNLDSFTDPIAYELALEGVDKAFEWTYFYQIQRLANAGSLFNISSPINFFNEEGIRYIYKTLISNAFLLVLILGLGSRNFAKSDLR